MRYFVDAVLLCSLVFVHQASAQDAGNGPAITNGAVREVTVYRDRALVAREIAVPAGEPSRSIEVHNLPELVIADSVFAEGGGDTTVRAVRVSSQPIEQSNREQVRELNSRIEELQQQQAKTQHALQLASQNLSSLDQLINFSGSAAKSDRERGVLDAESLTKLATFSLAQRSELSSEVFRLQQASQQLASDLQLAARQLDQATRQRQTDSYQVKIFVETNEGRAGTVRLSYLVGGCSWAPQYLVQGRTGEAEVELHYSAMIQQMSGENWNDVRLTLSTASPSVSAERPRLTPLRVSTTPADAFGNVQQAGAANPFNEGAKTASIDVQRDAEALTGAVNSLRAQQQHAESSLGLDDHASSAEQRDLLLNSLAGQLQQIELQADANSWQAMAFDVNDDVASQIYLLPQTVSLDTRREQQFVRILKANFAGKMYHVATPLLSTFAYREAELTNSQPVGLLGGPANVYLDGRFVGRTHIPSTASGQRLTIGFGADQQVRTRRELRSKQDHVQGGNRHVEFTYRLVLANFKDEPVTVRLTDRLPTTRQSQQLSVQLDTMQHPLSVDGLYQRVLRPTGVLRWDLTVPKERYGSQAFDVDYTYSLEFDRSRTLATQHTLAEMRADYQEMGLPSGGGGGFGGGGFGGGGLGGSGR